MRDLLDPSVAIALVEVFVLNVILLSALLAAFGSSERGYLRSWGATRGWPLVLVVSSFFAVLSVFEVPVLLPLILWWAYSLTILGLKFWQSIVTVAGQALICWLHATPESFDPSVVLIASIAVVVNTVLLVGLLSLFRPGEQGYLASNGSFVGWVIALAASILLVVLSLLELPSLVIGAVWWILALCVFRLTVRQTFKANVAQAIVYWAVLLCLAALG